MSSRCREAAESSRSPAKKETRCAPSSVPSKLQQSTTPTARASALLRSPQEEEAATPCRTSGGWRHSRSLVRISARSRGASLHRIGRRARRPSRAGLGGFLLEGLRPCPNHEEGAWAPLGGVLRDTFPSGGHRARIAHRSGVHHQDHPGIARCKGHARQTPLAGHSFPSR